MMDISDGQIRSLKTGIHKDSNRAIFVVSQLIGREIEKLSDLTRGDWFILRDEMYPNWHKDDWSVSDEFRKKRQNLLEQYQEQILGQKRLF